MRIMFEMIMMQITIMTLVIILTIELISTTYSLLFLLPPFTGTRKLSPMTPSLSLAFDLMINEWKSEREGVI